MNLIFTVPFPLYACDLYFSKLRSTVFADLIEIKHNKRISVIRNDFSLHCEFLTGAKTSIPSRLAIDCHVNYV